MLKTKIDPLDLLFSEVKRKDSGGYCEVCGVYFGWQNLQCCHFYKRQIKSVRWDERNTIAGCVDCHTRLDNNLSEKEEFFRQLLGQEQFDLLNIRMKAIYPKPDKQAIKLALQKKLRILDELSY